MAEPISARRIPAAFAGNYWHRGPRSTNSVLPRRPDTVPSIRRSQGRPTTPGGGVPVLQLHAVTKRFGGLPALDGVDLTVAQREIFAITGPNGAGKSTLLKAISGVQPPTSGRVLVDDEDITGLPAHAVRHRGIAQVPQHPRVLAGRPRLLLLDEVMAGLHPVELQASIDVIRTVRDHLGLTVVWVEHVMKAVTTLADRVLVLNFGRKLAEGRQQEVLRDPEVIAAYLGRDAMGQTGNVEETGNTRATGKT